jgi:ATP-dependent Lon protease
LFFYFGSRTAFTAYVIDRTANGRNQGKHTDAAKEDIDQQQREYFLQQQIKTIQDELGGSAQEQK